MKFPKLQKAISEMMKRLGVPSMNRRPIPIEPLRLVAKWNPNQKQIRKARRRAFAAGDRKAFS